MFLCMSTMSIIYRVSAFAHILLSQTFFACMNFFLSNVCLTSYIVSATLLLSPLLFFIWEFNLSSTFLLSLSLRWFLLLMWLVLPLRSIPLSSWPLLLSTVGVQICYISSHIKSIFSICFLPINVFSNCCYNEDQSESKFWYICFINLTYDIIDYINNYMNL